MLRSALPSALLCGLCVAAGCGDNIDLSAGGDGALDAAPTPLPDARTEILTPQTYVFGSRFIPSTTSQRYSEAVLMHVLADEIDRYLAALSGAIDSGARAPVAGEVEAELLRYYDFDLAEHGRTPLRLGTEPPALEPSLDSVASGVDISLSERIAGVDTDGQHRDFASGFTGWSEDGVTSPDDLVRAWLRRIDELAVARAAEGPAKDPAGRDIAAVYITPEGQDLRALLRTFLLGAVDYYQATDRLLDDATPGLGLLASNAQFGELPYSAAEHEWDLAFGYFGAAFDLSAYYLEEVAGTGGREGWSEGYHDSSANERISLGFEYNFASARLAAQQSAEDEELPFLIFRALLQGRAIIEASGEPYSEMRRGLLVTERDRAVATWEQVIERAAAASAAATLSAHDAIGGGVYNFAAHARAWSEMKGYLLALQFNPRGGLDQGAAAEAYAQLHAQLGQAPVLEDADAEALAAYRAVVVGVGELVAQ